MTPLADLTLLSRREAVAVNTSNIYAIRVKLDVSIGVTIRSAYLRLLICPCLKSSIRFNSDSGLFRRTTGGILAIVQAASIIQSSLRYKGMTCRWIGLQRRYTYRTLHIISTQCQVNTTVPSTSIGTARLILSCFCCSPKTFVCVWESVISPLILIA